MTGKSSLFGTGRHIPGGFVVPGIPFARAPVAGRRWRRPETLARPPSGSGAFPAAPWQRPIEPCPGPVSEDCLYLNVWTPDPAGRRPVLVWLYGGGFERGSASPPTTDGGDLMRRADLVVVAPNYRLGALGFLHLAGLDPEQWADDVNVGHLDQVAALRWVQDNIHHFGGDPRRVTLAGESAGAFSIGAMAAMPTARSLFARAVLISGGASRAQHPSNATAQTRALLARLSVDRIVPARLAALPTAEIIAAQDTVIDHDIGVRNRPGGRIWGGVVDGAVITTHPSDAVRSGAFAGVDLLTCAALDEMRLFELVMADTYAPANIEGLRDEMRQGVGDGAGDLLEWYRAAAPGATLSRLRTCYLTDYIYRARSARLAADQAHAGGRAWTMLFGFGSPRWGEAGGAHHGLMSAYVVGQEGRHGAEAPELTPRRRLAEILGRFAWHGDPGWPTYASGVASTFVLGPEEGLVAEPHPDTTKLWDVVTFP